MTTERDHDADNPPVNRRHVVLAVGVSVGGLLVHNLVEFPLAIVLAPETLLPVGITIMVGVALLHRPGRGALLTAAAWAVIIIVFGGGSVLPLNILPFIPEQTVGHYAAHIVYALAQLPLLWVAWRGLRDRRQAD